MTSRREPPGRRPHWASPRRRNRDRRCGRCGGDPCLFRCPSQFDQLRTADQITDARLALLRWWDVQRSVAQAGIDQARDDFVLALSGRAAELGVESWEVGDALPVPALPRAGPGPDGPPEFPPGEWERLPILG